MIFYRYSPQNPHNKPPKMPYNSRKDARNTQTHKHTKTRLQTQNKPPKLTAHQTQQTSSQTQQNQKISIFKNDKKL